MKVIIHDLGAEYNQILQKKCDAVIHMDPIITKDESLIHIKEEVGNLVRGIDDTVTLHDFRMVVGPTHTNLIFDIVVPFTLSMEDEEIVVKIQEQTKAVLGENYFCVIQVDKKIS